MNYFYSIVISICLSIQCPHSLGVQLWIGSTEVKPTFVAHPECLQPKLQGPCRASLPRYFYNIDSKSCERFLYGGCDANGNNFETLEECTEKCVEQVEPQQQKSQEPICSGPPQQGKNCEGILPRWTFNTTTKECTQFIYGGCGATGNHFVKQIDCQLQCGDTSACSLPKDPGPCVQTQTYWWFDSDAGDCLEFEYGGCAGNSNRFYTKDQCQQVCKLPAKQQSQGERCEGVRCPGGVSHYNELNCKPIYDDGACCPTRYECPEREVSRNRTQCVFKNKVFNIGESVRSADSDAGCRASCTCTESGINCAHIECADVFGYYPREGCQIGLYKPATCCAYDYACGNETVLCEFEGNTYVENERIYPNEEPCLRCYCKPGFNGTLTEEFCEKIDCGIQIWYRNELERGCTPVYFQNKKSHIGCCPISWQCPEDYEYKMSMRTTQANNSMYVETTTSPTEKILVKNVNENVTKTENQLNETMGTSTNSNDTMDTFVPSPRLQSKSNLTASRVEDVCSQPQLTGDCKAQRLRYFYNSSSNECEQFSYSGCRGNENNFVALTECRSRCVKKEEDLMGRFGSISITLHHNDKRESDPCTLPVSPGRCRAYFPRYFFNVEVNRCQFFIYGGCHRNANNFFSIASCEATCTKTYPNVCDQKPMDLVKDCGGGENATKFYFDSEDGYCKRFISTGCTGQNVFNRLSECDSVCGRKKEIPVQAFVPIIPVAFAKTIPTPPNERERICFLPKKVGACYAQIPSYYYDVTTKSCKSFMYGGCFGNLNRFPTLESCRSTCELTETMDGVAISFDEHDRSQVEDPNAVRRPATSPPQMVFLGEGHTLPTINNVGLDERSQSQGSNSGAVSGFVEWNREQNQTTEEPSFIFARSGPGPVQRNLSKKRIMREPSSTSSEELQKPWVEDLSSKQSSENKESSEGEDIHGARDVPSVILDDNFTKPQVEDPDSVGKGSHESSNLQVPQVEGPSLLGSASHEGSFVQQRVEDLTLIVDEPGEWNGDRQTSPKRSIIALTNVTLEPVQVWKFRDPVEASHTQTPTLVDLEPLRRSENLQVESPTSPQGGTREASIDQSQIQGHDLSFQLVNGSGLVKSSDLVQETKSNISVTESEEQSKMGLPLVISPRLLQWRSADVSAQSQKQMQVEGSTTENEQRNKTEAKDSASIVDTGLNKLQTTRNAHRKLMVKPNESFEERKKGICKEDVDAGNCNQNLLRFYWDGRECRPFNFTGCSGNRNRFMTEYDCLQVCDENFQDVTSTLYCIFGKHVIPFGRNLDDEEACGMEFCTCSVPPSLTCTVKSC